MTKSSITFGFKEPKPNLIKDMNLNNASDDDDQLKLKMKEYAKKKGHFSPKKKVGAKKKK